VVNSEVKKKKVEKSKNRIKIKSLKAKDPQSKPIIMSRSSNNLLEAWERRQSKQNVEPAGIGLVGVNLGAQKSRAPFTQAKLKTELVTQLN